MREACACADALNYQYCLATQNDSLLTCNEWLATIAPLNIDKKMMSRYAADCSPFWQPKIDQAMPQCRSDCYSGCIGALEAKDSAGNRRYAFGTIQQLNHNLIEIDGGDGRLVLFNTYGTDPFDASFDRVKSQQLTDSTPDNVVSLDYHDLTLEQAALDGKLAPLPDAPTDPVAIALKLLGINYTFNAIEKEYSLHLDPAHVVPLSKFSSVEVCPSKCAQSTVPPIRREQDELIPVERLNPADRTALLDSAPVFLQKRGDQLVEVIATKRRASTRARGDELLRLPTDRGDVTVLRSREPNEFQLVGEQTAIDEAFGSSGQLTARFGLGSRTVVTPTRATAARPRSALKTAQAVEVRVPKPIAEQYQRSIAHPVKPQPDKSIGPTATARGAPSPKPKRVSSLFTSLYARGFFVGSAPLTVTRTGPRTARLAASLPTGARAERITFGKETISLIATDRPNLFRLDGKTEGLFDSSGRARIWSSPDGTVTGVPANQATAAAKTLWKNLGSPYDVTHWSGDQPASLCKQWVTTPAHATLGAATAPQLPRYAVVVHDLHAVTRTNYYDSNWRLLRTVNHNARETSNYNYKNGNLSGAGLPAGDRICQEVDFFAHPLQVSHFPAPGYGGDAQPQVTAYSYNADQFLTDVVTDAGSANASTVHLTRDAWDRVTQIDSQVDAQHRDRTVFGYDQTPATDPRAVNPNTVTRSDGSIVRLAAYDLSGGGPQQSTVDASGTDPLHSIQHFDRFGRSTFTGRVNHSGSESHSQYDLAGLLIKEGFADLQSPGNWVDTTITYNDSEQTRRVSDPKVETCFDFDALDQIHVAVERPKDQSAPKSTCYKYDVDGRLEYIVHPEGNVSWFHYDDAGRPTASSQGYPSNLSQWTAACLHSQPPLPQKQTTATGSAGAAPRSFPLSIQSSRNRDVFRFDACAAVTPEWPSSAPPFDPGIQTLRVASYQPGGFRKSQTDGSGVGVTFTTDGFGRPIITKDGVGNRYRPRVRPAWSPALDDVDSARWSRIYVDCSQLRQPWPNYLRYRERAARDRR